MVIVIVIVLSRRKRESYQIKDVKDDDKRHNKSAEYTVMYMQQNKNDEELAKPVAMNNPVYSLEGADAVFQNPTYLVSLLH